MTLDLSRSILVDHHAHSLMRGHLQFDAIAFRRCFSETRSLAQLEKHVPKSAHYQDLLTRLGASLGEVGEAKILDFRSGQKDREHLNALFDDVSIGALIVDDGFHEESMISIPEFADLCERPVYRCLRIESALEESLTEAGTFGELCALFERKLVHPGGVKTVAFKTIAAYRGGLEIGLATRGEAEGEFDKVRSASTSGGGIRITAGKLYHYLLLRAFEIAAERKLPVQIHAGIGDDDADLRYANPLCMREVLHGTRFALTTFVFLHCYPFHRETAYLCSVYPNVSMDLSLAMHLNSPSAAAILRETLSGAPFSKLLAATDGHSIPETYWYGAWCWKRSLQSVLDSMVSERIFSEETAGDAASAILHDNARNLYDLEDLR